MTGHPLARAAFPLAGFAGGAIAGFLLAGPAMLADGSDAERGWTVLAAIAAWVLLAAAARWLAGSPPAATSVTAGAMSVPPLLALAEPGAWPVAAALLAGIVVGLAAGTVGTC